MRKLKMYELNRKSIEDFQKADKASIIIMLDNIRSGLNIGSAFRTSDSFRVEEVALTGICVKPPHQEINKTALGADRSMNWRYFENSIDAVNYYKKKGYIIISIEQVENSIALQEFVPKSKEKFVLIFGNEVKGVDQKLIDMSDLCIEIPQFGTKHSLNISVSLGVVVWDFYSKMYL